MLPYTTTFPDDKLFNSNNRYLFTHGARAACCSRKLPCPFENSILVAIMREYLGPIRYRYFFVGKVIPGL